MDTRIVNGNRSPAPAPRSAPTNRRPPLRRLSQTRALLPSQPSTPLPNQGRFGASALAAGTGLGSFLGGNSTASAELRARTAVQAATPSHPTVHPGNFAPRSQQGAVDTIAQAGGQAFGAAGVLRTVLTENGTGRAAVRVLGRLAPLDVLGAAALPGQTLQAGRSIVQANLNPTTDTVRAAANDTSQAVSTGGNLLRTTVNDLAPAVARAGAHHRAANAFRNAVPGARRQVVQAAARAAAQAAMANPRLTASRAPQGASIAPVGSAETRAAADRAARAGGHTVRSSMGAATNSQRAASLLRTGGNAAARAATVAVSRSAAMQVARMGARFVPGVNVAMAVADSYVAGRTMMDPNASLTTRTLRLLQAGGSIAAATGFPPALLIGGAIATAASIAADFSQAGDEARARGGQS